MEWQRSRQYIIRAENNPPRARDGTTQTANYMKEKSSPDGINPIENLAFNKIRWWHVWSLLLLLLWKWSETRMWNTHRKPQVGDWAMYGKASLQFTSFQTCWIDITSMLVPFFSQNDFFSTGCANSQNQEKWGNFSGIDPRKFERG